jgi:hypothetical protein
MAVLKHNPFTILHTFSSKFLSLLSLSLTKRDSSEFVSEIFLGSKVE